MNYEEAKKLKDAGFPQAGHGSIHTLAPSREENMRVLVGEEPKEDKVYIPTLSELIAACGAGFSMNNSNEVAGKPKWGAGRWSDNPIVKYGDFPEEAVANLWLALNAK